LVVVAARDLHAALDVIRIVGAVAVCDPSFAGPLVEVVAVSE
jgi:hypothetical protein